MTPGDRDRALEAVRAAAAEAERANRALRDTIQSANEAGLSWAHIGRELRMTRQAAWERFHAEAS